jgi:predicted RNase H-like HicB family nuclease
VRTKFDIEFEQEEDGRWIAEVVGLPGVLVYGSTQEAARIKAIALAEEVITELTLTT